MEAGSDQALDPLNGLALSPTHNRLFDQGYITFFMIKTKHRNKIISDKLCIKRKDGLYGTEYVEFLLPDGKAFWSIVTILGE